MDHRDERRFNRALNGRLSRGGTRLTVVEDFVYDDGEKNRLTWVFDRAGEGRWTGRREDTVGEATVVEENGVIRLSTQRTSSPPRGEPTGLRDVNLCPCRWRHHQRCGCVPRRDSDRVGPVRNPGVTAW